MRKDTYRIGDGTFAFSPAVFDSLLGHGAKGAARMRELAGAMHVSISSIKDWRRGTHAPSDFEKVEDIACWAHIDVADLLIESEDRTMDEKLTENQLDVLCVLWNQAYDFLDLCEETDHFVWPTTDLRCVPDSILHDIKVNPEDDKSRPPWEIGTEDLFLQTLDVYLRACRRATPYVGESDIFVRLLGLCDIMAETAFGEDDGKRGRAGGMGPPGAHMGGLYGNDLRDGIARDAVHGNRGYRRAAAPFVGAVLRGRQPGGGTACGA